MDITTFVIAGIICLLVYALFCKPDPRLPPFPTRPLPIVGNMLSMKKDSRVLFRDWRQQCGDIFSLYMAGTLVVVLNGYDIINEALVKKADIFSNRPPFFIDQLTGLPEKGVIFSSGKLWKEQRTVSLSILRAFGMGKNLLADKIQEEVSCFIKYLADLKGKPTDIGILTNISTSNIICSILMGNRFEYSDTKFQDLIRKLTSVGSDQQFIGLVHFISWLKYVPGDFFKAKKLTASIRGAINALSTIVLEKRSAIDDPNDVRNLIDAYLLERNKRIQAGMPTTLDDENLMKTVFDLFAAGTETTSTTMYWCVLYVLNTPEVQENVYREIKDKVGTNRTPTIQDKNQLTYLSAVIVETQRLASIIPLSVTHLCSEETTLRGYTIPKGSWIMPNLDSVLHDKATWGEDALSFRLTGISPQKLAHRNQTGLPEKGVIFSSGKLWKEQRTVSLSILRAFGMGKNLLADKIQEEVSCFIKYLADLGHSHLPSLRTCSHLPKYLGQIQKHFTRHPQLTVSRHALTQ